jgi:hypothetical protein
MAETISDITNGRKDVTSDRRYRHLHQNVNLSAVNLSREWVCWLVHQKEMYIEEIPLYICRA